MKQQLMTAPGEITFRDVPVPEPGPGEVLVRISWIGICGSDLHVWHGTHPFTPYPVTQGHEVSGVVEKTGKGVRDYQRGDKVLIQPQVVCGECYPCRHGRYNLCENLKVMGFQTTGTASEYFCVESSKLLKLPPEMDLRHGAMMEPLAVAVHAVNRFPDIFGQAKSVAVMGAGPIGNLVAQTAAAYGAKVLLTDISPLRLELARNCGIEHLADTSYRDFNKALIEVFGPDKADVIFDCAGNDITINQAIRSARKGSTIILVAVFGKMATVDLAVLNDHELDLNTSMMYRQEDFEEAIRLASEGRVELERLITDEFSFEDYAKAYDYIDRNRENTMKVLMKITSD